MTLLELREQITIQGIVNLKIFNEDGDVIGSYYTTDFEYDMDYPAKWLNLKVGYMYYAADALQIELIKED